MRNLEAVGEEDRIRHLLFLRVFWHRLSLLVSFISHLVPKFHSHSTSGLLARIRNALLDLCTACARKQIWRKMWIRFSSSRFKSWLDNNVRLMCMWWYCFHLNMAFWFTGLLFIHMCVCLFVCVCVSEEEIQQRFSWSTHITPLHLLWFNSLLFMESE